MVHNRIRRALLAGALAACAPAPAAEAAAPVVESFSRPPYEGWRESGRLRAERSTDHGQPVLRFVGAGALSRSLPRSPWAVSFDVRPPSRGSLAVGLGRDRTTLRLRRTAAGIEVLAPGFRRTLRRRAGWRGRGWHHVAITGGARPIVAVDGRVLETPLSTGATLSFRPGPSSASIAALVTSRLEDAPSLLLHRLAELRAQAPSGRYPFGTDTEGRVHFQRSWTSGFWPGALWQAADRTRDSDLFRRWALEATLDHIGRERANTHDHGFLYGQSSVAAHERLCRPRRRQGVTSATCARLRRSGLRAAGTLVRLAAGNAATGTIPTRAGRCGHCESADDADTLVDSVMNLSLLLWAGRETGRRSYRAIVRRHATAVARLHVRPDGSTAQSVHTRRGDGSVIRVHTHQGHSDDGTWSRGQSWALYGFAEVGAALRDRALLATAEHVAGYVAVELPADGVPPYAYDAPEGAPLDLSAGVIAAAGLFRLERACASVEGACTRAGAWRALATRMLSAALARASMRPPLGFLAPQVYTLGGATTWDDDAELVFGLDYALEAVNRQAQR